MTVIYARCSTAKQKENLERQKDRLARFGYEYLDAIFKNKEEEANECIMAETLPELVREYIDYLFVYGGTLWKVENTKKQMEHLVDWGEKVGLQLEELVVTKLGNLGFSRRAISMLFDEVFEMVVTANEAKGVPGPDGKVPKGPHYVDLIDDIVKLMDTVRR